MPQLCFRPQNCALRRLQHLLPAAASLCISSHRLSISPCEVHFTMIYKTRSRKLETPLKSKQCTTDLNIRVLSGNDDLKEPIIKAPEIPHSLPWPRSEFFSSDSGYQPLIHVCRESVEAQRGGGQRWTHGSNVQPAAQEAATLPRCC